MQRLTRENPDLAGITAQLSTTPQSVVFFIGAGLSQPLGFPLWDAMLLDLIDHGIRVSRLSADAAQEAMALVEEHDYLACGQVLRDNMGERVDDRLRTIFSKPLPAELSAYDFVIRLPCAGFITTNYDAAIETAFVRHHGKDLTPELRQRSLRGRSLGQVPFLIKLHGDVRRDVFYLSQSDYDGLADDVRVRSSMDRLFGTYTVVFLGFGLADRDIDIALGKLVSEVGSGVRRHVALLPATLRPGAQRWLEDHRGVNVVRYDPADNHAAVSQVVAEWALHDSQRPGQAPMLHNGDDCGRLLRDHPDLVIPDMTIAVRLAVGWLEALPNRWGPGPMDDPRATNIAEGLIALSMADGVATHDVEIAQALGALIEFQDGATGGFVSAALGKPNVETHALAMLALHQWQAQFPTAKNALDAAADWLPRSERGWGRCTDNDDTRVIPSSFAFAALLRTNAFPTDAWRRFADDLLDAAAIDYVLGSQGRSRCAASWLLWLLGDLHASRHWTPREDALTDLALDIATQTPDSLANETEFYATVLPGSDKRTLLPWLHSTAPAIALGCLPWIKRDERAQRGLGTAVAALLVQAHGSQDGRFVDPDLEHDDGRATTFHSMFSVWALARCIGVLGPEGPES